MRPAYLYHVTWQRSLRGIAERGLLASGSGGIAPAGYAAHARGRLFATGARGVLFWFGRSEDHASDRSDNPIGDGYTPVVLRLPDYRRRSEDDLGTRDAFAPAYIMRRGRVAPTLIDLWDGRRWLPVARWRRLDPKIGYTFEDDDGETLAWFKPAMQNPLLPKVYPW